MNELMHDHVCYDYDYVYARMFPCANMLRTRSRDAIRQVQVMYRTSKECETDDDHDMLCLGLDT
jgi:hypothetical protein